MLWFGMPPVLQPLVRSTGLLALPRHGGNTSRITGLASTQSASSESDVLEQCQRRRGPCSGVECNTETGGCSKAPVIPTGAFFYDLAMAIKDPVAHFWSRVDIRGEDECWPWDHPDSRQGYGHVWFDQRVQAAHRVAKYLSGADVQGAHVHHKCENPSCCNPAHLEVLLASSHQKLKRTSYFRCPKGHRWTKENTYWKPRKEALVYGLPFTRECRACHRLRNGGNLVPEPKKWTHEVVLLALLEAQEVLGRPPAVRDFNPAMARKSGNTEAALRHAERGWPNYSTITSLFGSWADALRQAGITVRRPGIKI